MDPHLVVVVALPGPVIGSEKPRRDNSGAKSGTWLNDGWSGKDGDGSGGGLGPPGGSSSDDSKFGRNQCLNLEKVNILYNLS